jgi:hypothetical protein
MNYSKGVSDHRQGAIASGVAGVVVVPGGGGQGQDALQDPDQDVGRGVAAVAFQVELNP